MYICYDLSNHIHIYFNSTGKKNIVLFIACICMYNLHTQKMTIIKWVKKKKKITWKIIIKFESLLHKKYDYGILYGFGQQKQSINWLGPFAHTHTHTYVCI